MRVLKLTLAAAILSSGLAYAEETTKENTETKKTTVTTTTTTTVQPVAASTNDIIGDSAANREGKRFTVNAALIGYQFRSSATSIELGYHLSPNSILTLQYSDLSGSGYDDDEEDEADEVWERNGKGHSISAGLKQFVSNSFYVKPELYGRTQDIVHSTTSSYDYQTDKYTLTDKEVGSIRDIGASVRIGNQWQWENFTMGCDWVGFARSLTTLEESGKITSNELSNISLLNFYLGATF